MRIFSNFNVKPNQLYDYKLHLENIMIKFHYNICEYSVVHSLSYDKEETESRITKSWGVGGERE